MGLGIRSLVAAVALSGPLASGCNDTREDVRNESIQIKKEREIRRKEQEAKSTESAKAIYPLEKFRHIAPGIHLFDKKGNNVLDLNEVDLFIEVVINSNTGKYTEEGKNKLSEIIKKLDQESYLHVFKPDSEHSPTEILRGYHLIDYSYCPNNIAETLKNFRTKYEEYEIRRLDQIDAGVKSEINKALK